MRRSARWLGLLLVVTGVAGLAFVGYELWGSGLYASQAQNSLRHALQRQWNPGPAVRPLETAPVRLGDGVAVLRVPRFGRGYAQVIVEGVARGDLRRGPGHYPGSAMPGQVGNFAVAGHRTTYGAPFGRLDELRPGDAIVLETRASWLTYRVTGTRVVAPNEVAVTAPVPDAPGRQPTQALLTLTTCNPRYSARQRLVVFGLLAKTVPNAGGSATVGASAAE